MSSEKYCVLAKCIMFYIFVAVKLKSVATVENTITFVINAAPVEGSTVTLIKYVSHTLQLPYAVFLSGKYTDINQTISYILIYL